MMSFVKRHVLAVFVSLAVLAGGGAAAASAALGTSSRPSVSPTASLAAATPGTGTSTTSRHGRRAGRLAALTRAVHGDLVVKTKNGYQTVTFDRGTVTAASPASITLHRADGVSVTIQLAGTTRYTGISGPSAIGQGTPALVVSHNGIAIQVAQRASSTGNNPSSASVSQ